MALTNYSELKSSIADFLNRDDLTSVIPTFISLAEAQFARDLRHYIRFGADAFARDVYGRSVLGLMVKHMPDVAIEVLRSCVFIEGGFQNVVSKNYFLG